jgi:hypothetical protein
MDQIAKPAPAPINASVTLPRVLPKNEVGELGVAAGWPASLVPAPTLLRPPSPLRGLGAASVSLRGDATSSARLAGDKRVSCAPAWGLPVSPAVHGSAAAASARLTLAMHAAVRLINGLTWTSSCRWQDAANDTQD